MYLILEHILDEDEMEGFKPGTINDIGKCRDGRPAGFRGPVVLGLSWGRRHMRTIRYLRLLSDRSHPPSSRRPHRPPRHSLPHSPLQSSPKCRDESLRRLTILLVPRLPPTGQPLRAGTTPPVRALATPTRMTTPSKKKKKAKTKTFLPSYPPPPPTSKLALCPQFSSLRPAHPMIRPSPDM